MPRLFIAADLPALQKQELNPLLDQIRKTHVGGIRWSRSENLHITVKFLGETDESQIESISKAMEKAASGTAPFNATVGPIGAFRNHRVPRVLWIGVDKGRKELQTLAKRLNETREYQPHLTLARFKRDPSSKELEEYNKLAANLKPPATTEFLIDQLHLIESNPTPKGSSYKTLFSVSFKK